METEYLFDEIHILGEGLLASGKAILTGAGAGYEGEFYVSSITLDRGPTIRRDVLKMPPSLEQFVFQSVARQIEDSRDAQSEWDDFEEGLNDKTFIDRPADRREHAGAANV